MHIRLYDFLPYGVCIYGIAIVVLMVKRALFAVHMNLIQ